MGRFVRLNVHTQKCDKFVNLYFSLDNSIRRRVKMLVSEMTKNAV